MTGKTSSRAQFKLVTKGETKMSKTASTISINPFCLRQVGVTNSSTFGGFTGTAEELQSILDRLPVSLSKGVEIIRIYADDPILKNNKGQFICTFGVVLPDEEVSTSCEARRPGEQPVTVKTATRASRPTATTIDLVFYSHQALEADASSDADYELVSINTMPTKLKQGEEEPMTPETLWRNYLSKIPGCPAGIGGTYRPEWDDEEVFRKELSLAETYWADKARIVCK